MKPTFFTTPQEFRTWLEKRHLRARELWVGFHKKSSGQYHVAGGSRRSALLWMDRWATERPRRSRLCDPFHAAQTGQHLERCECQTRRGPPRTTAHAAGRPSGVRGTRERSIWNLFVRATQSGGAWRDAIEEIPGEPEGLGVLSSATSIVPEGGRLVGHHREDGDDETQPPRTAH